MALIENDHNLKKLLLSLRGFNGINHMLPKEKFYIRILKSLRSNVRPVKEERSKEIVP